MSPGAALASVAVFGTLASLPLHGGASVGAVTEAVTLPLAVVALGLLSWVGTVALDAALGRLL